MERRKALCAAMPNRLPLCLVFGALSALILMIAVLPKPAGALEIIPSVGITRSVESDDVTKQMGLALRTSIVPRLLQSEIGGSYRSEKQNGGAIEAKMWPVTASLWLSPIPTLYAGAGVGWYHTTLHYQESLGIPDDTKQNFGVHLGGGMKLPLAPGVALDFSGRYVFLQNQESHLVPRTFDPDYWTLTAGLALGL